MGYFNFTIGKIEIQWIVIKYLWSHSWEDTAKVYWVYFEKLGVLVCIFGGNSVPVWACPSAYGWLKHHSECPGRGHTHQPSTRDFTLHLLCFLSLSWISDSKYLLFLFSVTYQLHYWVLFIHSLKIYDLEAWFIYNKICVLYTSPGVSHLLWTLLSHGVLASSGSPGSDRQADSAAATAAPLVPGDRTKILPWHLHALSARCLLWS